MANLRVTKEFDWEMAHALDGHDGKCHNIHGHSYVLSVTLIGSPINEPGSPKDGMVIDFGDVKKLVKEHIVNRYDHALVLRDNSRFLPVLTPELNQRLILTPYQPTCENLLLDMVSVILEKLGTQTAIRLHSVQLHETQTSFAAWYASDNP